MTPVATPGASPRRDVDALPYAARPPTQLPAHSPSHLAELLWEISHADSTPAALERAVALAGLAAGAQRCVVISAESIVFERGFEGIGPPLPELKRALAAGAERGLLGDWGEHALCIASIEAEPRTWLVACRTGESFAPRERDRVFTIAHVLSMTIALLRRDREGAELRTERAREAEQLRAAERELAHQALHDRLTGLPNRELMLDRIRRILHRVTASEQRLAAALLVDIDGFRQLNDALDQEHGDQLLAEVGARLAGVAHEWESADRALTVGRYGADEFVLLGERLGGEHDVMVIADRVRDALAAPFGTEAREVRLTVSIGVSCTVAEPQGRGLNAEHFISDAEVALDRAREQGGDRVEIFDQGMRDRLFDHALLEADLREAIHRGELRLLYQPVVAVTDSELTAVEALVRWQHPLRGLLGPGEFIPLAEQSDLIVELGAWVIDEACAQIRRWRDAHPAQLEARVSVNVSARQLTPALIGTVTDALARHQVAPAALSLEITETMLVRGTTEIRELLHALAAIGVPIVLDDFGTGYSSLSYLKELPLQQLKLDRSFCSGLQDDARSAKIVAATIEMARALGMTIVAEGVETPEQLTVLRRLGSDFAQGFWFARPEPPEQTLRRLVDAYESDSRLAARALEGAVEVETSLGTGVVERRRGERRQSSGRRADDERGDEERRGRRPEISRLAADAIGAPMPLPTGSADHRQALGHLAGVIFIAGSLFALPADVIMHAPSVGAVVLLTLMGILTGAGCLALPWHRLSERWLHGAAVVGTLEITTSAVVDGAHGPMLAGFYGLMATLIAYGFRDRRAIALQTAFILTAMVLPTALRDLASTALPGVLVTSPVTVAIVVIVVYLRERLESTADRLRELAERDPLTEIGNYRVLHESLRQELATHRAGAEPLAVLLIDLDRFKHVNERLGHAAGDDVLRRVARALRDAVREQDTVARQGGDEFAVLAPNTDAEGAAMLAVRLRQRLRRVQFAGDAVDATIGCAIYPADGDSPQALLAHADSQLLGGKRTGAHALTP